MPPKKQKQSLADFLNDSTTGGSWADEMDDFPTAPMGFDPSAPSQLNPRAQARSSTFDRERTDRDRPPRPDVPFPDAPPYTAFVGNLSFDVNQAILLDFFKGLTAVNPRLVTGHDGKPKGFGYVEFESPEGLRKALEMTNTQLEGRMVRISVAEPPKERDDRTEREWVRSGPLPDLPGRRSSRLDDDGPQRDWGEARGSKFAASEPPARRTSGFGRDGPAPDINWGEARGSKFTPTEPAPVRRTSGFGRDGPAPDINWGEARGSKFTPTAAPPPQSPRLPTQADATSSWRRSGPLAPAAPAESTSARKPLSLAPRSTSTSSVTSPTTASSKPNPFGAATPVDTAAKEAEVTSRLESATISSPVTESAPVPTAILARKDPSVVEKKDAPATERKEERQPAPTPAVNPWAAKAEAAKAEVTERAQAQTNGAPPEKPSTDKPSRNDNRRTSSNRSQGSDNWRAKEKPSPAVAEKASPVITADEEADGWGVVGGTKKKGAH